MGDNRACLPKIDPLIDRVLVTPYRREPQTHSLAENRMPYASTRNWTFHRPPEHLLSAVGISANPGPIDDSALVDRVITAYRLATKTDFGSNFWTEEFAPLNKAIHLALIEGNKSELTYMLRNPRTNLLFHGFEMMHKNLTNDQGVRAHHCSSIYDFLLAFCEAAGVSRLEHAESYRLDTTEPPPLRSVEDILLALDCALGIRLEFPNPYPDEMGIPTSRGVASFRAVQCAYQGYRIARLAAETGGPVVEIGGGLGRTAYYCAALGVKDYTIVDIPLTAAAQSYYLGRTCGEDSLRLYGETRRAKFNIIPPDEFFSDNRSYGLVVNIDSMPEISDEMAAKYLKHIATHTKRFLSINHETLSIRTVREIALRCGAKSLGRHPYWLRRGYVDELFGF